MSLGDLWVDISLRWEALAWTDWLDLLLVTAVIFVLVTALQRARATFILRGLTLIGLFLLVVALLLPLPAFSLPVRGILLFMLIAVPVVFQRELRHLLENVGRRIGFNGSARKESEELMQPLVRAVQQMAAKHIGALIVLEGEMDPDEIAETGVPIGGRISSELLNAIFFPKNPLHDGVALIRGQTVVAAASVLPVSRRPIKSASPLGTRHRAALGLSEQTDALALVVSEETGDVSVARGGSLQRLEDQAALREQIVRFAHRDDKAPPTFSRNALFDPDTGRLRSGYARHLCRGATRLALALLFAASLWWFVLNTSSPLPDVDVDDVPLQVGAATPGLALVSELPENVDLVVRTVGEAASTLHEESFVATVSLDGLSGGVHRLPVEVTARLSTPVQIVDIDPETMEVDLAPVDERSLPVSVVLEDTLLSAVYEVQEAPAAAPEFVEVNGPRPLIEQVAEVRATVSLSSTYGLVESTQPLEAFDADGNSVRGVTLFPPEADVRVTARRGSLTIERPAELTISDPASTVTVTPETVELLKSGPIAALREIEADPDLVRVIIQVSDEAPGEGVEQVPQVIAPEGIGVQMVPSSVTVSRP